MKYTLPKFFICMEHNSHILLYYKRLKKSEYNKQYRDEHKDKIKEVNKKYYKDNKESLITKYKSYRQNYYKENKQEIIKKRNNFNDKYPDLNKQRCKVYRGTHKEEIKKYRNTLAYKNKERTRYLKNKENIKIRQAKYYIKNREIISIRNSKYTKKNRTGINNFRNGQYRNNQLYRIRELCRANVRRIKKMGFKKNSKTEILLGTSYELFKEYFQSKFNQYMTWEHFMNGLIHIDHITPLSSATTQLEIEKLCHYTNLQPLWATTEIARENGDMISIGNLEKSNKV